MAKRGARGNCDGRPVRISQIIIIPVLKFTIIYRHRSRESRPGGKVGVRTACQRQLSCPFFDKGKYPAAPVVVSETDAHDLIGRLSHSERGISQACLTLGVLNNGPGSFATRKKEVANCLAKAA